MINRADISSLSFMDEIISDFDIYYHHFIILMNLFKFYTFSLSKIIVAKSEITIPTKTLHVIDTPCQKYDITATIAGLK